MNHFRQLCAIVTLVCAFTLSAHAGEIECGDRISQPDPMTVGTTVTTDGNIECTGDGNIECEGLRAALTIMQGALLLS